MSLVPGDAEEEAAHRAYSSAMASAIRVVEEHAPATTSPSPWERTLPAPAYLDRSGIAPLRPPTANDLRRAEREGWLVAVGQPPRPSLDGELEGMVLAVKDVIDVAGLPTRNGTRGGRWREPDASAVAWQRLAEVGAVCLGKSATHEMAWGVTTPQIANPRDRTRMTGGSSGGSAACVAAGIAPAALGTDTGGSIRIPAGLCGVVGVRPTWGSIPLTGVTPLSPSQDCIGPIARDEATCALVLEVLLGRPLWLSEEHVAGLRVGVLRDVGNVDDATAGAYRRTIAGLEAAGVTVVACETDVLRLAGATSLLTMLTESAGLHGDAVRAAPDGFSGEARVLLTIGDSLRQERAALEAARRRVRDITGALTTEHDVDAFLTPTTACVAPRRHATEVVIGDRTVPVGLALSRFTAWAAVTGLPAISVPVETTGLPVGMQLIAPAHREDLCLLLGRVIRRGPGG